MENFNKISDTALRNCTRASANNFFLPRVKGQGIHTFYYSAIKNWNSLPANIKKIQNENTFKDKAKRNISFEARNIEECPFLFLKIFFSFFLSFLIIRIFTSLSLSGRESISEPYF